MGGNRQQSLVAVIVPFPLLEPVHAWKPTTAPNSFFRTPPQNGGDRQRNADEYPFMATEQKAKGVLTLIMVHEKRFQNEKGTLQRLNKAVM